MTSMIGVRICWGRRSNQSDAAALELFAVVPDAIQCTRKIIRHQKRAVTQLSDVHGPAEIFAILIEPAFSKRLHLVCRAVLFEVSHHHASAHRNGAVPGAMLC